jgi:hypothetical protein
LFEDFECGGGEEDKRSIIQMEFEFVCQIYELYQNVAVEKKINVLLLKWGLNLSHKFLGIIGCKQYREVISCSRGETIL